MNPLKYLAAKLKSIAPVGRVTTPGVPASPMPPTGSAGASPYPPSGMSTFIAPAAQVRWLGPGVAWYTPQRVEQIFRQALSGDLQSQWEMFDLMEATSPRLAKNLNQLKDDVLSQGLEVRPFSAKGEDASDEAKARASLIEQCLKTVRPSVKDDEKDWEDTLRGVMDARGKGMSILEIAWETRPVALASGEAYAMAPRCTRWVHPAWYGYEHGPGDANLKLKQGPFSIYNASVTNVTTGYLDFPDNKFIIAVCKNKEGHPLGSALLHTLGFWWAAANLGGDWLLNLAQTFGQPTRWATYDPNMTPGDQDKLAHMLAHMGSSAWAMFPAGTEMEFKEAVKNAGESAQKVVLDYYDKLCDLVILRQTLSSDVSQDAGSRAQGEVHERVLGSAELAVSSWLCKTLKPLVNSICLFNYGDLRECPDLTPPQPQEDESESLSTVLKTCSDAGLEPTDEALPELSDRIGFDLQRKAPPEPTDPVGRVPSPGALKAKNPVGRVPGGNPLGSGVPSDPIPAIVTKYTPELTNALRANFAGAVQIIRDSTGPAELEAKLAAYFADWRPTQIINALSPALQECAAEGATADHNPQS